MATQKVKNKTAKRAPTHRDPVDEHAATELVMYIENTSDLSPDGPSGQGHSILLNALRKWKKGTYDSTQAVKLFEYLTEAGAKRYAIEMGSSPKEWSTMFNPATRHEAAKQLEASFRNSVENGEYEHVDTRIGVREVDARRRPGAPERSMTYPSSPSGRYVLTRDGQEVMRGSEEEIWRWMHRNHSYSIDHALRYEGYKITPVENAVRENVAGRHKLVGPGSDNIYRYRGASIELSGPARGRWWATVRFRSQEKDFEGRSSDEALDMAKDWIDAAPEHAREVGARRSDDRPISMSYGELPDYNQFKRDIHTRIDPEKDGKTPYWPHGNYMYPMELTGAHEIELAEEFGGLNEFETERSRTGRNSRARGFKGDEAGIYDFLRFLKEKWDDGDEEAGDLASSIMTTLGYEWI